MDNTYLIPIGKRIAEIRKSNGLTQEALSNCMNLSPKHISHVERGCAAFSLKNFIDFCSIFNTSLDYVILGENNNSTLNKLPPEIIHLLNTGNELELDRLNRYLLLYVELLNKQE